MLYFNKSIFWIMLFSSLLCLDACSKYLDETPEKSLTIPQTAQDLRAILDNSFRMSENYSALGAVASDDYYLTDNNFNSLAANIYISYYNWGFDREPIDRSDDWFNAYNRIFYANNVLDYLNKVELEEMTASDISAMQGEALFYRAFTTFQLTQIYAMPYNPATAKSTKGIPLRLSSDFNIKSTRPTLEEDFQQIVKDLENSIKLLPINNYNLLRPNRTGAYAALANVYLVMQNFEKARDYADSCLRIKNDLMDYNDIDSLSDIPFPLFNKEILWHSDLTNNTIAARTYSYVDSVFYKSFDDNDLRKHLFFQKNTGSVTFNGYYNGRRSTTMYFNGFAVDELYLIKAETEARLNNLASALSAINSLTKNRLSKTNYTPFKSNDQIKILAYVLDMRRKELCFRGMYRWMDIRRLNELQSKKLTLQRTINGKLYELKPGDLHYAFLIPSTAIDYSDMKQNAR